MKRHLSAVTLILLLSYTASADVDVLSADGSVYLAWTDGTGSSVAIVGTDIQRTFSLPHISIGEVGPSFDYLAVALYGLPDTLLVLDPITLGTELSRPLVLEDFLWPGAGSASSLPLRVARHNDSDSGIYLHATSLVFSPNWYNWAMSTRLVPDQVLGLTVDASFYYGGMLSYSGYGSGTRPFQCASQDPPTQFFKRSFGIHMPFSYTLRSSVHQGERGERAEFMDCTNLIMYSDPSEPSIKSGGSCQDAILLLWSTEDSTSTMCATFDGMTSAPLSMEPFDLDINLAAPWAMSCNRQDPGLLLVWIDGDGLMCRHYQDGWNQYGYQVGSGVGTVEEGDLAVCSDDQGYWIAWLEEGKADPEVLFVPRGSVTPVVEAGVPVPVPISVVAVINPLRGVPLLQIDGLISSGFLKVFDVSGRMVYETELQGNGAFPVDLSGSGVYFAVVSCGSLTASERFTLLD